jgi:hypothetical protein
MACYQVSATSQAIRDKSKSDARVIGEALGVERWAMVY